LKSSNGTPTLPLPPELSLEGDERLDRLCEGRAIIQRARGHRASTDDQLLAWALLRELDEGALAHPSLDERGVSSPAVLELGAGKGTVTLWLSLHLTGPFIGLEAFEESYHLSLKNRSLNGLEGVFSPLLGDVRDEESLLRARRALKSARGEVQRGERELTKRTEELSSAEALPRFELICGAPPFMKLGAGVLPKDPQRAAGRFELRGGVEAYIEAMRACLVPGGGRACLLMDGLGERRALEVAARCELELVRLCRVSPRPSQPPTYSHGERVTSPQLELLAMRDEQGEGWSEAYLRVLQRLSPR
jgi:tRNA1(Val) A37 N6-methylase TrmN6